MKQALICISCPIGCRLTVTVADGQVAQVEGNLCPRGESYAKQEAIAPMRVFTGNMKALGCAIPFSVRSDRPIPRDLLLPCAAFLKKLYPPLPVCAGDVILEHVLGTDSAIIATQALDKQPPDAV